MRAQPGEKLAYIWFCRDANNPAIGDVVAAVPFEECVEKLRIVASSWGSSVVPPLQIADVDVGRQNFSGYHHVVVELDPAELTVNDWKPGFYLSPLMPREAAKLLGLDQP